MVFSKHKCYEISRRTAEAAKLSNATTTTVERYFPLPSSFYSVSCLDFIYLFLFFNIIFVYRLTFQLKTFIM